MSEIKAGDTIVLTGEVPDSTVYPWVKAGAEGVVAHVFDRGDEYRYQIKFEGTFWMQSGAVRGSHIENPTLLFKRDEIELKVDTEDKES